MSKNHTLREFSKYVSLNVLGMIGLSCYILADTFFVSNALGANGLAALNFSISIYSIIHGVGLMLGIGGATRYSILKSTGKDKEANEVFTHAVIKGVFFGIIFVLIGILFTGHLALLLGADQVTLPLTKTYLTTIFCFSPFFILNNTLLAFVRNDHQPKLAMTAMIFGSLSNIVLDYIFIFPLSMGMFGAAFATGLAPIISVGVLSIHFIQHKNQFKLIHCRLRLRRMVDILSLGLSSFITEVSSGIVLIVFNLAILKLEGNVGVAAYGIIANLALVVIAIFTGIAQGIQPLISKAYGRNNIDQIKQVKRYAVIASSVISIVVYIVAIINMDVIVSAFNNEKNQILAHLAKQGIWIYFIGFIFAGINIVSAAFLSATEKAAKAFLISILRGCILIIPFVLILSSIWEMNGIWLSFVCTEAVVSAFVILSQRSKKEQEIQAE